MYKQITSKSIKNEITNQLWEQTSDWYQIVIYIALFEIYVQKKNEHRLI